MGRRQAGCPLPSHRMGAAPHPAGAEVAPHVCRRSASFCGSGEGKQRKSPAFVRGALKTTGFDGSPAKIAGRGRKRLFSPRPARGERSSAARVRGPLRESERRNSEPGGTAPSPHPLPASGARECEASRTNKEQKSCANPDRNSPPRATRNASRLKKFCSSAAIAMRSSAGVAAATRHAGASVAVVATPMPVCAQRLPPRRVPCNGKRGRLSWRRRRRRSAGRSAGRGSPCRSSFTTAPPTATWSRN